MVETYILQNLVAFADTGTLVAASEKVNVTQPSLTRSFKKLEDALEIPLFERTKNAIRLNQTGLLVVDYARKILSLHGEMERAALDLHKRTRKVRIVSVAPAPLWHLTELFKKSHPETKVTGEVFESNGALFSALEKDEAQIAISTERADGRFFCAEFSEEHLNIFVPKSHRLASKKEVSLSDLAGETFIMYADLGFWAKIKRDMIPNAKFITQDELTDLRDIIDLSALPTFRTDYSEKWERFPAYKKDGRVSVPITDDTVNVKFYAVCKAEMRGLVEEVLAGK